MTPWLLILVAITMTAIGAALGMGVEYVIDYRDETSIKADGGGYEPLTDRMDGDTE